MLRRAELVVDGPLPDEVELVDLPLSLLDPTVRVRILGDADVVAAGVRVGLWVRPGGEPPKAPEQKELEEVRRKLPSVTPYTSSRDHSRARARAMDTGSARETRRLGAHRL